MYDKRVLADINKAFNAGLSDSKNGLEQTARSLAPERSGKYKRSIGTVHIPEKMELYLVEKKPRTRIWSNTVPLRVNNRKQDVPRGRCPPIRCYEKPYQKKDLR